MEKIKNKFKLSNGIRTGLMIYALLIIFGTIFYQIVERWNWLDSLYFSVITLATVGYGDLHPTQDISKVFTMIYVLVGVGFFLYLFSSITEHFFREEKEEMVKMDHIMEHIEEMMEKKVKIGD